MASNAMTTALALPSSKTNWTATVPARAPPPPPPVTQATMLKRTHEIQCGKCAISDYAENIGVWNDDGTLQELGLCGECEEDDGARCDICCGCGKFTETGNVCECGGGHRELCDDCKVEKPDIVGCCECCECDVTTDQDYLKLKTGPGAGRIYCEEHVGWGECQKAWSASCGCDVCADEEEEDEQTCDGCGTTCLDHTSNKGRGSESPCEECGETRCKFCPCECEEATTEFARNKICDECGCKGGCELTCVYVCGEETHDCNQCSYSLTSKEFYAGKGRIMFSEGDGIKEGEYKCDECHKKKKKKKKRKRLVIVDKLCKSTPCQLIKDEEWNMKCSMCDGYYKDDGLHDILDVNDDENRSCKLCGNSDNVVIMKGTGSCVCAEGCDDDEEDVDVCERCGEELDDDSDNIDGHLCLECDREENGGTLFAESNPIGLLRCKNCKKNDNFFAMDDPELCVPCVDLLYYSNK